MLKKLLMLLVCLLMVPFAALGEAPPVCDHTACFWALEDFTTDPEVIWPILTSDITVVSGKQRELVTLRSQPSASSDPVGEVTCRSQAVHVLEHLDNGWSLIECYSSCAYKSALKVYNQRVKGYIKTNMLETRKTDQKIGLTVDKLTQRMYIYQKGKLTGILGVSTGIEDKPYNVTYAGAFQVVSRTGAFTAEDGSICDKALRICGGVMIHEVPYVLLRDGTEDYRDYEPYIGQPASHGCIRVQRKLNPQGMNMTWLWKKLTTGAQVLVFEDTPGRQLALPDEYTTLYYSEKNKTYYHREKTCYQINSNKTKLQPFPYGLLNEEPYAAMSACPFCLPEMRPETLQALNEKSAAAAAAVEAQETEIMLEQVEWAP